MGEKAIGYPIEGQLQLPGKGGGPAGGAAPNDKGNDRGAGRAGANESGPDSV